jgi:hypothetical protein
VKLKKIMEETEDYLFAVGVAELKIMEPETQLSVGPQRPELQRPNAIIGVKDWEHMRKFLYSSQEIPEAHGEQEAGTADQVTYLHSPAEWTEDVPAHV